MNQGFGAAGKYISQINTFDGGAGAITNAFFMPTIIVA